MGLVRSAVAASAAARNFIGKRLNREPASIVGQAFWPNVSAEEYARDRNAAKWRDEAGAGFDLGKGAAGGGREFTVDGLVSEV